MRIVGWICSVIGGLSFIGALSAGHSVFGPLFWLALGIVLLYFSNEKEQKRSSENKVKTKSTEETSKDIPQKTELPNEGDVNKAQIYGEMASGIYADLSTDQRWAILISQFCFFEFAKGTPSEKQAEEMCIFMANALNLPPSEMTIYSRKFSDMGLMMSVLGTITNRTVLDSVLYNSYGICMLSGKPISMAVLYKMYGQLGYSEQDVDNVVKKIEALGSMMKSL